MIRLRRAPLVIAATAAGLVGLLTFRSHPTSEDLTLSHDTSGTESSNATSSGPSSSSTSSAGTSSASTSSTGTSSAGTSSASTSTTTAGSTSTTTSSTASAASSATKKRTAVGESVSYNYGTLSVEVSASGTKITSVTIASLKDDGSFRSQSIDEQAIPTLEQEALDAQSANIQSISGASYTSEGFIESLQSALSKLGIS